MKDDVAKPLMSGRRRRQASRVLLYVLLQALIAVVCVLVVRMPPPEPSSRYLLTEFNLSQDGVARPVTLPHFGASRFTMKDPAVYTGQFTWPSSEAQRASTGISRCTGQPQAASMR